MSDRCPGHEPCAQAEEAPDGALWRSLEEREGGAESRAARQREFPAGASTPPPTPDASAAVSRRRFLSLVAASAALGAAGCSTPHDRGRMVPYTRKPEEVLPGVANYYATAFAEGPHVYPLLVKAREGRPIHITGNDAHPESRGKTTLRAQAEVLALYDPDRLREPTENGRRIRPEAATEKLVAALREAGERGSRALLLTGASTSPTRRALIEELTRAVPHLSHVAFEPAGDHAARAAALALYGRADLPTPRLDRARVVLAVEADFVSSLPDSARMLREFSETRRVRNRGDAMSRLYAVEGRLSLTGGNADHRLPLRPSRAAAFLFGLARELARRPGASLPPGADAAALADFDLWALCEREGLERGVVQALLADLADHRGAALVLCGPTLPTSAHVAAATLNHMLGAEGTTLDTSAMLPASACATPEEMQGLFSDLQAGRYAVVIFWESNPVHALPNGAAWRAALAGVPTRVFLGTLANETSEECGLLLPVSHWLESWGDYETAGGALTLAQPLIEPLYETRQAEEWLLAWLSALGGQQPGQYYDFLRERWQREYYPSDSPVPFNAFWNGAVHDGFLARTRPAEERIPRAPAIAAAAEAARPASDPGLELTLHPDARFWDGRHANNGWLAELPDPVSKQAWGNSLAVSPADAARLGLSDGDLVELRVEGQSLRAPALVQPGQAPGVLSLALGFGRSTGSVATGVGINAYPLVAAAARAPYLRAGVSIEKTGRRGRLIRTQDHWSLEGRDEDILRRMTLADYAQGHAPHAHAHELYTLYPEHASQEHKWGMAIDLAACVGCSGCMIACQSENNIPTVGPEQVARSREMAWIRIDRYYAGDPAAPEVLHQPMLCQHCDHAPCENVCPVVATTHSPDGLNQMIYNRCVGTRYCSNNCPYKVRRFNYFDYQLERVREPQEMVYNPEVTVRPRGVMEKCTFCVQRIQDARMRAKAEERPLRDGEITPACAAACPARAIVFGNLLDPDSEVSRLAAGDRGYKVLENLGVRPVITYLAHLTNPAESGGGDES